MKVIFSWKFLLEDLEEQENWTEKEVLGFFLLSSFGVFSSNIN